MTDTNAIKEQLHRIHVAVHDGTLDKATVSDALARVAELVGAEALADAPAAAAPEPA